MNGSDLGQSPAYFGLWAWDHPITLVPAKALPTVPHGRCDYQVHAG